MANMQRNNTTLGAVGLASPSRLAHIAPNMMASMSNPVTDGLGISSSSDASSSSAAAAAAASASGAAPGQAQPTSASSSSAPAGAGAPNTSGGGGGGGTKETWKKRKQALLAEARNHSVANLQLHGLRPPPNPYYPYYQNSSILGAGAFADPYSHGPGSSSSARHDAASANEATLASLRTAILRPDDPKLRNDIIRMVDQWLADEGFGATRQVLMDEAGTKQREREEAGLDARKLRGCLLEGDWPEVDKLLGKPLVKNHKAFLYAVYKQQFLEHIEHREFQKAFTFLNKRLKPLEHYQPHSSEFRDLCYLLSAKAVTDAPSFASWEGIQPAREKLVMEFAAMLEQDRLDREAGMPGSAGPSNGGPGLGSGGGGGGGNGGGGPNASSTDLVSGGADGEDGTGVDSNGAGSSQGGGAGNASGGGGAANGGYVYVPPRRLMTMLHQAVAYQVEFARYHPKKAPVVSSLLHDYTGFIVPNSVQHTMRGHRKNVKSVRFVGEEGRKIVSGSSDNTVRLWDSNTGRCDAVLEGHRSRVWDVDSTRAGGQVASASGDSTVKVWGVDDGQCRTTLKAGLGDVYCCRFHPDERHLVSAGYDKLVRMFDVETGSIIKTFTGHQLGVSSAIFNPLGNLIVTASKDTTIRFWDVISGLCIRTITGHLGEVTSVEMNENGSLLLSSSKDNSNRLWDVRMLRPLKRFKGHQNTSKNFIKSSFAHTSLLVGGSEDGRIYMWDQESSEVLQTLEGHGFDLDYDWSRGGATAGMGPGGVGVGGGFIAGGMPTWQLPSAADSEGGTTASTASTTAGSGATAGVAGGSTTTATGQAGRYDYAMASTTTNNNVAYGAVWNKAQSLLASCGDDGTVKTWVWDEKRDHDAMVDLMKRGGEAAAE
ncbi:related to TAF5 - subunit of TFIID and SAGA complexes [Pseudozyma flocculosa]|nr:related to TAF5 - subunit of TFIID and SAGA complexes [Pseudozyma flocculosa]